MRTILLSIFAIACLSAAKTPDPSRPATYSLVVDGVSLTVRLPTRNPAGKPIVVSIVLQNDRDQAIIFQGEPSSPFDVELYNADGKPFGSPSSGVDAPDTAVPAHSSIKFDFDLSHDAIDPGHYLLTVNRDLYMGNKGNIEQLQLKDMSLTIGKPDQQQSWKVSPGGGAGK